jgi:hypothetical protein
MVPDPAALAGPARLASYGLVPAVDGAVQIDITAVLRRDGERLVETYLCDHNCTIAHRGRPTGGHYNCPAAFTLNRGAVAATITRADLLLTGIERMLDAARDTQRQFAATGFARYADDFRLPVDVAGTLRQALTSGRSEVTLFGGSPEAHPEILPLVGGLHQRGHAVHVTMTGRRLIRQPEFLDDLVGAGVDVVAVSADDATTAEMRQLLQADTRQLRAAWRAVSPLHGQRQKVVEAVHTARLWQELPAATRPGLLFNIAFYPENVATLGEHLELLATAFPGARLNPFPMQAAFEHRVPDIAGESLRDYADLVEAAIAQHHALAARAASRWSLVPRLHYWLLLAAALGDADPAARLTGWNTWQCFRSAGAGRYVQVAGAGRVRAAPDTAGGRVGCFWNDVLNDDGLPAVWTADTARLRRYLTLRPSRAAARPGACPGCLFPRLVGDMVSLECGMDPAMREPYLELRHKHLGF